MKKLIIFLVANIFAIGVAFSQGAAINTSGASADPSAMLDVSGTSSGVLINRMTNAQKLAISSPATGLTIYQTDGTAGFYYFNGSIWAPVGSDNLGNHTATQDLSMASKKINNLATCTQNYQAANKAYVDSTVAAGGGGGGGGCLLPDAAGTISGTTSVCQGQNGVNYSVAPIANATGYVWTLPPGATIESWGNTNSIKVSFSASASSGNITVYGISATCNGAISPSYAVIVNTAPVTTAGNDGPKCFGSIMHLTATAVSGATYNWTGPNGYSASVQNPIIAGATLNTGIYNVTATLNGCVSSASSTTLVIYGYPPSQPGEIIGSILVNKNSIGNIYNIAPVTDAISYNWTVPAGASITAGAGTTSITVSFGNSGGNITVSATNDCGTSGISMLSTSIISSPMTINANGTGQNGSIMTFAVPDGVTSIIIQAFGAQGGGGGGLGAKMVGTFTVTPGQVLKILVGQQGVSNSGNGGGGGTFITDINNNPLIVAGGGSGNGSPGLTTTSGGGSGGGTGGSGGTGSCSGGGGGLTGNGINGSCLPTQGGKSFINGGTGGLPGSSGGAGGFGGGGGGEWQCCGSHGSGGGYSGGGGDNGGGGSYNGGTNQTNVAGANSGNGKVIITW